MTADLLTSATQLEPWTRALYQGLRRYGDTPIYSELAAEFAAQEDS